MVIKAKNKTVVALMGATGAGKSSFVNLLTGKEDAKVAHGLHSGTSSVASYSFLYRSCDFIIVDTPGFDDSHYSDRDILRILVTWLETSFLAGEKLSGILYFHRITDPRMSGSALRNLLTFKKLCGEDCYENIVLGTSFWRVANKEVGEQRESELKEDGNYWAPMIRRGSRVVRIPDDQREARELLFQFVGQKPSILQSQRETVLEGKRFEQTSASQQLQDEEELKKRKDIHERQKREQQARHEAEMKERARKAEAEEYNARQAHRRKMAAQERERKRLEEVKKAEEAKQKAAREAAIAEKERLEREAAELAERMEQLKIDRVNAERERKRERHQEELETLMAILVAAKQADKLMVNFRDLSAAYHGYCDNCMCTLGSSVRYQCSICNDGDFDLCDACHSAPDVYCDDKSHFGAMQRLEGVSENGGCKRVTNPIPVGSDLLCSRCYEPCGAVYLHCCFCDNDNFDMCVSCALQYRTCKKSWSLSGHPLDLCSRYTGKA